MDIALLNLLCADGLLGAEGLASQECIATLSHWTERVHSETDRHMHRLFQNPEEFEHSEGYFRMLMMAVVLYEEFSLRYNPARMSTPGSLDANDHFFADSRDVFLHGPLGAGNHSPSAGPALNPQPSTLTLAATSRQTTSLRPGLPPGLANYAPQSSPGSAPDPLLKTH